MNRQGNASGPAGDDTSRIDTHITEAYRSRARKADVDYFAASLRQRLASTGKWAKRRPLVRRLGLATAGVLLAAALGLGTWQAVEHLTQRGGILLIGDTVAPASGAADSTPQPPPFTYEGSRSVYEIKLADIWSQAAAAFDLPPDYARLDSLYLCWNADGLLVLFMLGATAPDGRSIDISDRRGIGDLSSPYTEAGPLRLEGSTWKEFDLKPASFGVAGPTIDQVLGSIDSVGLATIAQQSGVALGDNVLPLDTGGPEDVVAKQALVWSFVGGAYSRFGFVDSPDAKASTFLTVTEGHTDRIGKSDLLAALSSSSVQGFVLQQAWAWTAAPQTLPETLSEADYAFTTGGVNEFGDPAACVAVGPLSPVGSRPVATLEPQPVDARLDDLAYVTYGGLVARVRDGRSETMPGTTAIGSTGNSGIGSGVSYSLGRHWLVYRDGQPPVKILAVSTAGDAEISKLLTYEASNTVVNPRFDETSNEVWFGFFGAGPDGNYLLRAAQSQVSDPVDRLHQGAGLEAGTVPADTIPLAHAFGGDFALSPDGSTIVYLGPSEAPVQIVVVTPQGETPLPTQLQTAYSAVLSPDAGRLCVVGSDEVGGETSLWVCNLATKEWMELEGTQGLTPTYPAFSADGQRIAFRNWKLGDLWTIDADGANLTHYQLSVTDAPIAW